MSKPAKSVHHLCHQPGKYMRRLVIVTMLLIPLFYASAVSLQAQTAEQEEAGRIQIQTGTVAHSGGLQVFSSADGRFLPRLSPWLDCRAEYSGEDGRNVMTVRPGKDWSGVRVTAGAGLKGIPMDDTQVFENVALSLKFKPFGEVKDGTIQVALVGIGSDGKIVQTNYVSLKKFVKVQNDSWSVGTVKLNQFSHLDRLRNLNGMALQFTGKVPEGGVIIDGIAFERKEGGPGRPVKIEEVKLDNLELSSEVFPSSATNIRIKGPDIVRDGKPVFLTGVEDDAIYFPWLYKLMKFDIIQLQDLSPDNIMKLKQTEVGTEISWNPLSKWFETKIRTLLHNGLAIHANYWDFLPRNDRFKNDMSDHIATASHFYGWRLDSSVGRQIKENYTRATLRTLGKYPVTFYELYNELYYGDTSPAALRSFQRAMREKYGDISKANQAWSTSFPTFAAITPPWKTVNWAATKAYLRPQPVPIELYTEWQRFVERHLGRELRLLTDNIKRDIKYPHSYIIYQAVMNLHQDYSGMTNTYPEELMKAGDALCQEGGMYFYPQIKGAENITDIAKTARSMMIWDLLAGISPDKPVYLSECGIGTYPAAFDPASMVVDLSGTWYFADDSANKGQSMGYGNPDFDEKSWAGISVPGIWGSQGFPKCTRGWYRRDFTIPKDQKQGLFLTGKELADRARIYLNGKLIHETSAWNAEFSVDISGFLRKGKNTIALEISNQFEAGGQIQGGVRNFIAVTDREFFKPAKVTAGQMRSWFWSMAVHNISGVIMSYFYTPATNRDVGSIYNPVGREYAAIRAIPEVKNEIDAVSEILLPRPRLSPEIAFVYPFESGRAHVSDDHTDLYTGKITLAMMDYYLSALFSRFTPAVTSNDAIVRGMADKFKIIVMPTSPRVIDGTIEALDRYVRSGGILILGPSALSFNDCTHRPIPAPEWLGIKTGLPVLSMKSLNSRHFGLSNEESRKRVFDSSFGTKISLNGAASLAEFTDGTPAITVHRHGKGHVYYFACNLPFIKLKSVLSSIFVSHGLKCQVELRYTDGVSADYIESHVIGSRDRFVFYLNNFGGGERNVAAGIPSVDSGNYRITDIRSGKVLYEDIGFQEIRRGLGLTASSQDPVTWLFEKHGTGDRVKIKPLSAEHQRFLGMWNASPRSKDKILFHSLNRAALDPFRMLTGKSLLEASGFEINYALDLPGKAGKGKIESYHDEKNISSLSDFSIYVLGAPRLRDANAIKEIRDYVENGGSLLLSASADIGYFGWYSNKHHRGQLFDVFGLKCSHVNFVDEHMNDGFSPANCLFANITPGHQITRGVAKVQLAEASTISTTSPDQQVLIRSNTTSIPANSPFLVAMEFGKGRVVAMGDSLWLQPEWLGKEDNAQLMLNIFNWLARRDSSIVPRDELRSRVNPEFKH